MTNLKYLCFWTTSTTWKNPPRSTTDVLLLVCLLLWAVRRLSSHNSTETFGSHCTIGRWMETMKVFTFGAEKFRPRRRLSSLLPLMIKSNSAAYTVSASRRPLLLLLLPLFCNWLRLVILMRLTTECSRVTTRYHKSTCIVLLSAPVTHRCRLCGMSFRALLESCMKISLLRFPVFLIVSLKLQNYFNFVQ